ncbi:hypothetical protein C0J52_08520, partial [Blattella germanica]
NVPSTAEPTSKNVQDATKSVSETEELKSDSGVSTATEGTSSPDSAKASTEFLSRFSPSKVEGKSPIKKQTESARSKFLLSSLEQPAPASHSLLVAERQDPKKSASGVEVIELQDRSTRPVFKLKSTGEAEIVKKGALESIVPHGLVPAYVVLGSNPLIAAGETSKSDLDESKVTDAPAKTSSSEEKASTSKKSVKPPKRKRKDSNEIINYDNISSGSSISVLQTASQTFELEATRSSANPNVETTCDEVEDLALDIRSAVSQLNTTMQRVISFHPDRGTVQRTLNATPLRLEILARHVPQTLHSVKTSARLVAHAPVLFTESKANAVAACKSMMMFCDQLYCEKEDFEKVISDVKSGETSDSSQAEGGSTLEQNEDLINPFNVLDSVRKSLSAKIKALEDINVLPGDLTEAELTRFVTID